MYSFANIFLVSVYSLVLKIFAFISTYVPRSNPEENGSNFRENHSRIDHKLISENSMGLITSVDSDAKIEETEDSVFLISDSSKQEFDAKVTETEDSVFLVSKSSKYECTCGESVCEYLEQPISFKFTVQEMFLESNYVGKDLDCEVSMSRESLDHEEERSSEDQFDSCSSKDDDIEEKILEMENIFEKEANNHLKNVFPEEIHDGYEELAYNNLRIIERTDFVEDDVVMDDQDFSYEVEFTHKTEDEAFLEGTDLLEAAKDDMRKQEEENGIRNLNLIEEKIQDLDDDYIELEPLCLNLDFSTNKESPLDDEETTPFYGSEEGKNEYWCDSDSDDEEDVLWEHQNLVQQMKMELKHCRIGGLPTISEECETPKTVDDLKPLEIDKKFEYKDIMEEIHKFYKCYTEKMRKLDVLNYQTLHAISFLQLKDSEVFSAGKKKSSLIPFNIPKIWPCKDQRIYADSMHRSSMEMHRDLEMVYVGQLCLSWEILSWLYVKAKELMEYDSKGHHSYNRVAEEFQQFQVLLQRFMEDERFQGPRIQNYVKNRCIIRSLLHVPMIRDDCVKDKKERREETDMISLKYLIEIIRESMVVFRDFLRSDKGASNVALNGIHGTNADFQDTANSKLLVDIISDLQKKDRRIREHMRSQSCIVKKLQKHQEYGLDQELLMASQVELRLVSRVMCMSRLTTDQLVWCQKKLNNISFVRGRVQIESTFLLFPC